MKTRHGFVSNSSSSSFLVFVREGHDLRTEVQTAFACPKDSVYKQLEKPFVEFFSGLDRCSSSTADDFEDIDFRSLVQEGFTPYVAFASDEGGDPIGGLLRYNETFRVDSPNLKILPWF